jgi:hypothetical protein
MACQPRSQREHVLAVFVSRYGRVIGHGKQSLVVSC